MIKVQGLGRRRAGMRHDDCIRHHRQTHSRLGLGQAEHMGKYVLFYVEAAFAADGAILTDLPWDMSALEWFHQEQRWTDFLNWLETEPEGQDVKSDEETFLDRARSTLNRYEEHVIVDRAAASHAIGAAASVNVLRLLKADKGAATHDLATHHRHTLVPAITSAFGPALRKYVANHLVESISLAQGRQSEPPVDIVEIYKIDPAVAADARQLVATFHALDRTHGGAGLIDPARTITLLCEEVAYIP